MLQLTFNLDPNLVNQATISDAMLLGVKAAFLLGVLVYFIFSVVIVRQIMVMKSTLITTFSPLLQAVGWVHLLTVAIFGLMFLVIL